MGQQARAAEMVTAEEVQKLATKLEHTTADVARGKVVDMHVWNEHSRDVLEAATLLRRLLSERDEARELIRWAYNRL